MNTYQRLFGSGPLGVAGSLVLTLATFWLSTRLSSGSLGIPAPVRLTVLALAVLGTVAGIVWTNRSLPASKRGFGLCTTGAHRWVRHPLYASFLSVGVPGVALYLNHWLFLAWVPALHLLWHFVVRGEEAMMRAEFGAAYESYAHRTGRFVPRILQLQAAPK